MGGRMVLRLTASSRADQFCKADMDLTRRWWRRSAGGGGAQCVVNKRGKADYFVVQQYPLRGRIPDVFGKIETPL